jgi:type I restriction enzyme M protein
MALSAEQETMIWKTLNDTRGKIEPSEYKNYIFGVMFYKFLSEKAEGWVKENAGNQTWAELWEQDAVRASDFMKRSLGYVIQPSDLFSAWQSAISEDKFNVLMMSDSLSRFNKNLYGDAKEDFAGIFDDMDLTSTRLGNNAQMQTATMIDMINLMSKIETEDNTDVLGDLYEYLIGMFAANSGAKAGEFYTHIKFLMLWPNCLHLVEKIKNNIVYMIPQWVQVHYY